MTVIRPNSVSGINSITAQANEIKVFKSDGTQGGLIIGGANLNTTSGISTLLALNVTGNVSIAGTLTYQDVTNVDSLGIGTFRVGVNVPAGQLDVGSNIKLGNAGVITATSFVGSGANLTGITVPGGATNLDLLDSSGTGNGRIRLGASQDLQIYHDGSHSWFKNTEGRLILQTDGDQIQLRGNTIVAFNGAASTEYLRIDSSGRLLIGTTTEGHGNADELTISFNNTGVSGGDQGRCGMTIRSGDNTSGVTQNGYIYFSDGTSGGNEYKGVVAYSHSDDSMYFSTSSAEKLRIKTDGSIVQTSTKSFQLAKGTTGERPSGVDGMIRFNTTLSQTEEYRDSDWYSLSNKSAVTGGNVTTSGSYTIHTFTSSGTLTVSGSAKSGIEYLVVAGGGGGGGTRAGGGGAGGMLTGSSVTLQPGSYTVTVGAGGAAGTGTNSGGQGGNSVLGTTATAIGGGYGGGQQIQGGSGGSGGGGSDSLSGGAGTSGQGNNGGGSTGSTGGGGGGGKNGVGGQAPGTDDVGGAGGSAGASAISGSTVNYSGGGGGGSRDNSAGGNGGGGGAGRGGRTTGDYATAGSANQGGGGGGGGRHNGADSAHYNGAAGGSGIVIIRYLT